jgi:UDP-GlcNAc:undecaprenyl-phosphate/decaprenyl-phosphate GlcNAc-1-phosphate transferase
MGYVIMSFLLAAIITYLAIPVIINIANEKKLYDVPDDNRKLHSNPIPSLGGMGIFAGFIVASLFMWPYRLKYSLESTINIEYLAAACLVIFFLGVKDDILEISPLKKFIGQLIAAWLIIYKCQLQISSFHGVFGIYNLPNAVSIVITYLAVVLIINAFNLIDGVDGLSGTLTLISLIGFATYFYSYGYNQYGYAYIAAALAGAVAAFLIYNFHPAKIFMGDTGSLLIGFVNAFLLIKLISLTNSNESAGGLSWQLKGGPIMALSLIFIPLIDSIRLFATRILKGTSPFNPDRNHIHHLLLDRGYSHKQVTLILATFTVLIIGVAYISNFYLIPTASLIILILCSIIGYLFVYQMPKRIRVVHDASKDNVESKIVNF